MCDPTVCRMCGQNASCLQSALLAIVAGQFNCVSKRLAAISCIKMIRLPKDIKVLVWQSELGGWNISICAPYCSINNLLATPSVVRPHCHAMPDSLPSQPALTAKVLST